MKPLKTQANFSQGKVSTNSVISDTNTRASTTVSVNRDYSDVEESVSKADEIDLIKEIKKLSYGNGVGDPRSRYSAAVDATMKYLTKNVSIDKKYKQFNEDDLFNAIKNVAGLNGSKNNTPEFDAMKKKFKSNETGRNILNMLTGGSDAKAIEAENLSLQQQILKDKEYYDFQAEQAKQEAQKVQQYNDNLKNQVGAFESKLKEEQEKKDKLAEDLERQKAEALEQQRKLESEIDRLKPFEQQMQDLNSKIQGFALDIKNKEQQIKNLEEKLNGNGKLSDQEKEKLSQQIEKLKEEKQKLEEDIVLSEVEKFELEKKDQYDKQSDKMRNDGLGIGSLENEKQIKAKEKEEEIAISEEDKKRIGEKNTKEFENLNNQIGHLNDEKESLEKEKQKIAEEKLAAEQKKAEL